jgi:hypothetical protein
VKTCVRCSDLIGFISSYDCKIRETIMLLLIHTFCSLLRHALILLSLLCLQQSTIPCSRAHLLSDWRPSHINFLVIWPRHGSHRKHRFQQLRNMLHVTQHLSCNGCFSGTTILALSKLVTELFSIYFPVIINMIPAQSKLNQEFLFLFTALFQHHNINKPFLEENCLLWCDAM